MTSTLYIVASVVGLVSGAKVLDKAQTTLLRSPHSETEASNTASQAPRTIVMDSSEAHEQTMIVCNAFAYSKPLDIFNVQSQLRLTQSGALSYKSCQEFPSILQEGDRLEFKAGNASVGIFKATGIPKAKATLLLVPHRRDSNSMSAMFKSHAFMGSRGAQIAVVDTYRGKEVGKVKIMDAEQEQSTDPNKSPRVEDLHFNSVVALGSGKYQVMLQTDDRKDLARMPLSVQGEEGNFVVMRTGLQNTQNASAISYPQELVLYAEQKNSRSSAAQLQLSVLAAVLAGVSALVL
eukprot:CAMPEP_0171203010 /NCGR_PEP_ID=MMETSP0790-20130122/25299_1 /TAXON_ID=2925 /ORGANISM="Alexandrium catenella, Strain OF101" /LENGTH=291 /DNA_ID=CAMNT_0011668455 /DNA_START=102 /DNA_END=977 /DNA_ORIENTATION=+